MYGLLTLAGAFCYADFIACAFDAFIIGPSLKEESIRSVDTFVPAFCTTLAPLLITLRSLSYGMAF